MTPRFRWVAPTTLFFAGACTAPESESAGIISDSSVPAGNAAAPDPGDEGSPALAAIAKQVANSESAIRWVDGGYTGVQPAAGMVLSLGDSAVTVRGGEDRFSIRTASLGREGATRSIAPVEPYLGACQDDGVGADGVCVQRLEYDHGDHVEWWTSSSGQAEVGWELSDDPGGPGFLEIAVQISGAQLLPGGDEDGVVIQAGQRRFAFSGLSATDADGLELDAWMEIRDSEVRIVIDDAGATWPISVDPTLTSYDWYSLGTTSYYTGWSVAGAGDVNGDGYDDVIVGAPGYSSYTGRALVYHGSSTGLSYTVATTLTGSATNSYFGESVDGAGDLDADGYDDVIVGASKYSSGLGKAYTFHGSSAGVSSSATDTVTGSGTYYLGCSVAGAGDVNRDGYADVIIGAYYYSTQTGRAYVYHGGSGGISSANTTLTGYATSNYFGSAVDGAGDVNADGYDDVVVGGYYYSSGYGRAYVYHGSSSGISTTASRTLTGSSSGEYFGYRVRGVGDVNGDGYDDVAVAAPYYSSSTGRVGIYQGSSSGTASSATTTLYGYTTYNYFGYGLGGAGDVDSDGYSDVIVGSFGYSSYSGSAGIYPGGSTGTSAYYDTFITGFSGSYHGYSAVGAGDTNGDGYDDVIVGAYYYSSGYGLALAYLGYADEDGDGYYVGGDYNNDCNDNNYYVNPGVAETVGNGQDDNCDGAETCYDDDDNDGYLDTTGDTRVSTDSDCADTSEGTSSDATTDCDDTSPIISPAASEITGDGVDENCDGAETCYDDDDNDGYLDTTADTRISSDSDCADAYEGSSSDSTADCDDADAGDYPGATETVGNSDDENCDARETCYTDGDNDGYAISTTLSSTDSDCADAGEGTATEYAAGPDCTDTSSSIHPGATETTGDELDQNCDGAETCYSDVDHDGYATATTVSSADSDCDDSGEAAASVYALGVDCNDAQSTINPAATEVCDASNTDEDCDGTSDDSDGSASSATKTAWYRDSDADGYGNHTYTVNRCDQPTSYVANDDDCDDSNASANPGLTEIIGSGGDEDCDGYSACYTDGDGDNYASSVAVFSSDADCSDLGEATSTEFAAGEDCDDASTAIHPGASEVCDSANTDEDCDGNADDADSGADSATKTTVYLDADGDGYGDSSAPYSACDATAGYATTGGDCDDSVITVNPGVAEIPGDAIDNDCDGMEACYADADSDGWGSGTIVVSADSDCADAGEADAATYANGVDCDDGNVAANPAAAEVCDAAETDEDCDGLADDADADAAGKSITFSDADGDGYGDDSTVLVACDPPASNVADASDCDDADAAINPAAVEICDKVGVDEDCDTLVNLDDDSIDPASTTLAYDDGDGDGYGADETARVACDLEFDEVVRGGDCNDADANYYPGAPESDCTDSNDYNCDGSAGSIDADADGYLACEECDDSSAAVNPRASEICNEIDDDCDGITDGGTASDATIWYPDSDADGYGASTGVTDCAAPDGYIAEGGDCDDHDSGVNPAATELCDGTDQNCDGTADEGACDADSGGNSGGGTDKGGVDTDPSATCGCDASPGNAVGFLGVLLAAALPRRRRQ